MAIVGVNIIMIKKASCKEYQVYIIKVVSSLLGITLKMDSDMGYVKTLIKMEEFVKPWNIKMER